MKYSRTVLLSVLAFPYLVNARPSSKRDLDTDDPIHDFQPYSSQLLPIAGDFSPDAEETISKDDQSIVHGIERRWSKEQHGHKLDKPHGNAEESNGGLHGRSLVPHTGKDSAVGKSQSSPGKGLPVGKKVGDLKGVGGGASPVGVLGLLKNNHGLPNLVGSLVHREPGTRRAMEATAKRFHAHSRHQRSRVLSKRDAPSDIDILNFALTFEHLLSAFYKHGLEQYGVKKFREAGYERWIRRRYEQLAKNGKTHVQFLESALGDKAVKACRYDLKENDVTDWIAKSFVVENIAASAWNGFVGILQDRAYQTVAASIMGVKARHAAWINSVVRKSNAWNTAFETPLDMNQIYSIISPFIIPGSCPSTNATLRAKPFPALHVPPCRPGSVITLEYDVSSDAVKEAEKQKQHLFAAFVSGTGTVFVSMREDRKVEVPKGLVGVVYVFVTRDGGKVGNEGIVAGPGVVWFGFRA